MKLEITNEFRDKVLYFLIRIIASVSSPFGGVMHKEAVELRQEFELYLK